MSKSLTDSELGRETPAYLTVRQARAVNDGGGDGPGSRGNSWWSPVVETRGSHLRLTSWGKVGGQGSAGAARRGQHLPKKRRY